MITFNLSKATYYAYEGMTWGDWCESAYQTSIYDYHVCSDGYVYVNTESMRVIMSNGTAVTKNDAIIAGHEYTITPGQPTIQFTIAGTSYRANKGMTW